MEELKIRKGFNLAFVYGRYIQKYRTTHLVAIAQLQRMASIWISRNCGFVRGKW